MFRIPVMILGLLAMASTMAEPVEVFILSGQSNMVGSPKVAQLPESERAPIPQARFWNGTDFETLVPGKTKTSQTVERFGPELAFARHYPGATPEHPIYLIKYALGGRPLHHGWHHGKWLGSPPAPNRETFYPGEGPDDPNVGTLYQKLLKQVRPALARLEAEGIAYRVRGVLWMQGEADAKHEVSATEYAQCLRQWHQRLLEDIGAAPCPLVYGQTLPYAPRAKRFTHPVELRQSQANLDRDSGHPDAYEWARMVPTEGMDLADDTVHYNAAGQIKLGTAFADAMVAMLK